MPQINRIRIINFSYNSHKRHIVDETFDFYNGENAMLNLFNGGGKSVLVKLMLQPVLPKSGNMASFFKSKKTPAYILVEWKLEGGGGYLLTGIGLANTETQFRQEANTMSNIKYYTFTSAYRQENHVDLANIPLVRIEGQKRYVESYTEARRFLSTNAAVDFFNEDDHEAYKRHLESFNIFQDEWKSIMIRINESEGGVLDTFEKCKTSLQLMNEWILKSIEKVIHKDESDQRKLEQMFENLVKEMIDNEQYLYEREIYGEFQVDADHFLSQLTALIGSLQNEEQLRGKMSEMHWYLATELDNLSGEIREQEILIGKSQQELKKINLEERSKEYFDHAEKVEKLKERAAAAARFLEGIRLAIAENEKQTAIQEAARTYDILLRLQSKVQATEADINRIKSGGDTEQEMNNLSYSLKLGYEKQMVELREDLDAAETGIREAIETVRLCDEEIEHIGRETGELNKRTGSLESKIDAFIMTEEGIRAECGLLYERNLLGEIEEGYFDNYFQLAENKKAAAEGEQRSLMQSEMKIKQRNEETQNRLDAIGNEEKSVAAKKANVINRITEYQGLEKHTISILSRNGLDSKQRFRHEENARFIADEIDAMEIAEKETDHSLRKVKGILSSLKEGTLHVSSEFREWLLKEGIDFETGEKYLQKQNEAIRNDLIRQNPLLPFSFLLTATELEKVKTMKIDLVIHQLVPLVSFSDISRVYG
ncbi:hypothetical protein [Saccharococcus sp. Marseille-Q5394]|uniref:hypothetical protein n=1 Tax=Saccharococcus sp. Marseille-Q5394 TaxID=2972778 RepID=UPI0021C7AC76|nr:hypothetical protein [Saccharococcus sp. Marseille-Q5394]